MWEHLVDRMMRVVVRSGALSVVFPNGRTATYGDGSGPPLSLTFTDRVDFRRIAMNPELALPEAYVDGTVTIGDDDLYGFLRLAMGNLASGRRTRWLRLVNRLADMMRVVQQRNPVGRAQRNVAHHYDLSGKLYDLFLDRDKQYSCAYFRSPDDTLEEAQAQKKTHIADKLLLKPGMRVFDIGCGWGGMALTLARDYGARVLGVTLSQEQYAVATARAEAEGLADKVEFRLADYREVTGTFDRVVSVGMFEHVGVPHYRQFFANVRDRLTDGGVALIHTIGRITPPGHTNPWIARYIFPGGYVPAMSEVMTAVEREDLYPTDIEILRLHYAETLRHWHDRFMANRERVKAIYDERFCRMWRFYLVAAEMTFRIDNQCVFQFQISRDQTAVPLTRDYLYSPEQAGRSSHIAAE